MRISVMRSCLFIHSLSDTLRQVKNMLGYAARVLFRDRGIGKQLLRIEKDRIDSKPLGNPPKSLARLFSLVDWHSLEESRSRPVATNNYEWKFL